MTGRDPGPVAPFASWASSVARLRASFGFSQVAPPSSPRTRMIWSRSGVRTAPASCSAAIRLVGLLPARADSRAELNAMTAIRTITPRITQDVT